MSLYLYSVNINFFLYVNILFNNLCVWCSNPETVKGNARSRVGVIRITKHDDVID